MCASTTGYPNSEVVHTHVSAGTASVMPGPLTGTLAASSAGPACAPPCRALQSTRCCRCTSLDFERERGPGLPGRIPNLLDDTRTIEPAAFSMVQVALSVLPQRRKCSPVKMVDGASEPVGLPPKVYCVHEQCVHVLI
jgi:hypothetical protein